MRLLNKIDKIDESTFLSTIENSASVVECLKKFQIPTSYGGYYSYFYKRAKQLNASLSHFLGKGWNRGRVFVKKHSNEQIFTLNGVFINNCHLKQRYLKEFKPEYKCNTCGLSEWNSKPLTLHLDHINGLRHDNRIANLRLICPNCHSQTETYCRAKSPV